MDRKIPAANTFFYLQKGGKISGSLLNELIKKGIHAEFIEYASEKIMIMRIQRMQTR